jgi:hypothetical protein
MSNQILIEDVLTSKTNTRKSNSNSSSSDDGAGLEPKESNNNTDSPTSGVKESHAREKKSMRVPIIHEIAQPSHSKAHSPRIILEHVQSADGSRLYISPRGHSPSNRTKKDHDGYPSPRRFSPSSSDGQCSPKTMNLKFVSSDPEKSIQQFLSPRLEQSPRVLEARMLEMQQKYERSATQLTKSMRSLALIL